MKHTRQSHPFDRAKGWLFLCDIVTLTPGCMNFPNNLLTVTFK